MIFNLNEIVRGKPKKLEVKFGARSIGDPTFSIQVEEGALSVCIQDHPGGYFMKYEVQAKLRAPCSSCGHLMSFEVCSQGGVGLRTEQPELSHVVLKPTELEVSFLTDTELDLSHFYNEQIEFELPPFPRHENPDQCHKLNLSYLERGSDVNGSGTSPFSELKVLLEKES